MPRMLWLAEPAYESALISLTFPQEQVNRLTANPGRAASLTADPRARARLPEDTSVDPRIQRHPLLQGGTPRYRDETAR